MTMYSYDAQQLVTISSSQMHANFTWQGSLLVMTSERRQTKNGWLDSSFAVEYDELMRATSIQAVIAGTAVEPIQLIYDDKTAFMSSYANYQIIKEPTMVRIHGFKMMHERSFDAYRQPFELKIVIGDVRLTLATVRDVAGRTHLNTWQTISGKFKEVKTFDAQGRLATCDVSGKAKYVFKYNNDSRIILINDVSYEWHSGGVPKKVGQLEYGVDGNGWTIKRGDVYFELDGYGRLIGARGLSVDMKFDYDHLHRLISIQNGLMFYSLFYTLPHLPHSVSHFQSSSDSTATAIFYTEEGVPFAMSRDGFRFAIALDDDDSLRYVLSESGIEKEVHRDPLGRVIADTQTTFWVPLGFHGGIDIPELYITIMKNGRPYDTILGRYMSFGPYHISRLHLDDISRTLDPFALEPFNSSLLIPTDVATWFRLAGLSPILLPSTDSHLFCQPSVCARSLASFPSRLRTFSHLSSLYSSELLDSTFTAMFPSEDIIFGVEDAGFHDLLLLTPKGNMTSVDLFPILDRNESAVIQSIVEPAQEISWRVLGTTWERHFVRPDAVPSSLTSSSLPHFTLVISRNNVELRNGKTKIFVHFSSNAETVNKMLMDDLRRREGPDVWRAERKRIERGESRQPWTQQQKRELLAKSTVSGYTIELDNSLEARFLSVHIWRFVKES
ncbi:hypothetical protein DICVIV_05166 [Dictyocaulus viviparus]|uniref:Uncharacterized protein n=1 Tax=Dictyocaulus viviparus TaxID=29172 RepID=A0A0D8XW48_DICVI|nr:hypothetical protein DICVIV_05166 [Dictyocaulus viviparus]